MIIQHIEPGEWNSRAVIHGGYVWLSGIVAGDKTAGIKDQTADVLERIDGFLAKAGSDKTKIVSAVIYIAEMAEKDGMNAAWIDWMGDANPPARACVGVELTPGTKVEIMCQAVIG
jgi:enamine deaminase RidA (YjgF/YER057c/UK114 family)